MRVENEINAYLAEIKRAVPFLSRKEQKLFFTSLRESLENYMQENPGADRQDIIRKFGSPEEIADSYLSSLETREVTKKVGVGKWRRKMLLAAVAVVAVVAVGAFAWNWHGGEKMTTAYEQNSAVEEEKSINPFDYPEDSKERYIASVAAANNYTYEQAAETVESQAEGLDLPEKDVLLFRTVDKAAGKIEDGHATALEVNIAVEVMYISNTETGETVSLVSAVNPYLYVPELSDCTISSGDFNIAQTDTDMRLSVTASMSFGAEKGEYTVGGDVFNITDQGGKSIVVTNADTYVIEIGLENMTGNDI